MMNILLYDWQSQSQHDLREALERQTDVCVIPFAVKMIDYNEDPEFEQILFQILKSKECNICMSFDFFPVISKVCQEADILYVSWIYDLPHITLYSPWVRNSCNLIFSFDKVQSQELKQLGVTNVFHLPLAVNVPRLDQLRQTKKVIGLKQKKYDISFVGSLYENNCYEQITYLPAHLKGYLDGICRAQMQLFGVDILTELLREDILTELSEYVKLNMDQTYLVTYGRLFSDLFLKKYISSMERKERLELLGKIRQVALFSGSHWTGEGINCYGTVDYMNEMPLIFSLSKININMTIRSITSGIPLRCMDILGAGGFLFSNYQPELEEYFVPEREWVSFQEAEEMLDKAAFYLQHDELRNRIAENGYQKVKREFTYDKALGKMLGTVRKLT